MPECGWCSLKATIILRWRRKGLIAYLCHDCWSTSGEWADPPDEIAVIVE